MPGELARGQQAQIGEAVFSRDRTLHRRFGHVVATRDGGLVRRVGADALVTATYSEEAEMTRDDRSMQGVDGSRARSARGAVPGACAARSNANVLGGRVARQKALDSASCHGENYRQVGNLPAAFFASGANGGTFANDEAIRDSRQFSDESRLKPTGRPDPGPRGRGQPGGPWPLACLLLLLSACAQQPPAKPRPAEAPINLSGYSPAFRQGFTEGCGTARGNERRDEQRYAHDAQYARGWDDGRAICAKR